MLSRWGAVDAENTSSLNSALFAKITGGSKKRVADPIPDVER